MAGTGPATSFGFEAKVLALSWATPNVSHLPGSVRLTGTSVIAPGLERPTGSLHPGNEQTNKLLLPLRGLAVQGGSRAFISCDSFL